MAAPRFLWSLLSVLAARALQLASASGLRPPPLPHKRPDNMTCHGGKELTFEGVVVLRKVWGGTEKVMELPFEVCTPLGDVSLDLPSPLEAEDLYSNAAASEYAEEDEDDDGPKFVGRSMSFGSVNDGSKRRKDGENKFVGRSMSFGSMNDSSKRREDGENAALGSQSLSIFDAPGYEAALFDAGPATAARGSPGNRAGASRPSHAVISKRGPVKYSGSPTYCLKLCSDSACQDCGEGPCAEEDGHGSADFGTFHVKDRERFIEHPNICKGDHPFEARVAIIIFGGCAVLTVVGAAFGRMSA